MAPGRQRPKSARGERRQRRHSADPPRELYCPISLVARERLVAPVPRERDRDVPPRDLRDEVGGEDRLVAERLVEERREPGDELDGIRLHDELLVHRAERARRDPRMLALVVARVVDADGERLHGLARLLCHEPDDDRGVDPAGEERSQRDVADQAAPHGGGYRVAHELEPLALGEVALRREELPVRARVDAALLPVEDVTRREPLDPADSEVLARDVLEREVRVERGRVELPPHTGHEEERLELGGEGEAAAGQQHVVQRLLADAVAGEEEPLALAVPDRDREHAGERRREVGAALLVHVRDHGRVAGAGHLVAARLEVAAHVAEVVQLAVEHRDDVAGLVRHGLLAGLEVDDAESPVPEDTAAECRHSA